jgi:hypothetical protein
MFGSIRAPDHVGPLKPGQPYGRPVCLNHAPGSVLIRADRRASLRATVLAWITPFPDARCISGCAARRASPAADLSPLAIAVSTFLTKVRMRDLRALFRAVRVSVCRMRLRAEAVLAIFPTNHIIIGPRSTGSQPYSLAAEDRLSTHASGACQGKEGQPRDVRRGQITLRSPHSTGTPPRLTFSSGST